jgi:hypothetical protein
MRVRARPVRIAISAAVAARLGWVDGVRARRQRRVGTVVGHHVESGAGLAPDVVRMTGDGASVAAPASPDVVRSGAARRTHDGQGHPGQRRRLRSPWPTSPAGGGRTAREAAAAFVSPAPPLAASAPADAGATARVPSPATDPATWVGPTDLDTDADTIIGPADLDDDTLPAPAEPDDDIWIGPADLDTDTLVGPVDLDDDTLRAPAEPNEDTWIGPTDLDDDTLVGPVDLDDDTLPAPGEPDDDTLPAPGEPGDDAVPVPVRGTARRRTRTSRRERRADRRLRRPVEIVPRPLPTRIRVSAGVKLVVLATVLGVLAAGAVVSLAVAASSALAGS